MINTIPPGDQKHTVIIGRSQGYLGLAVNFSVVYDNAAKSEAPCLRTAHQPTPEEIAKIVAGAPIVLELITQRHPPMSIYVGDTPEPVSSLD